MWTSAKLREISRRFEMPRTGRPAETHVLGVDLEFFDGFLLFPDVNIVSIHKGNKSSFFSNMNSVKILGMINTY